MIAHGAPLPGVAGPAMRRHRAKRVVNGDHAVAGLEPQGLADQGPGHRVERPVELDVAVAMHARLLPDGQARGDDRQGLSISVQ